MGSGDKHRKVSDERAAHAQHASSAKEFTRQAHRRLQKGDLQGALEHYEQAVQEAKSLSDPIMKISSYLNAGACLVSLGHYRRGLDLLESACKVLTQCGVRTSTRGSSPALPKMKDTHLLEMSADVHFNAAVAAQGLKDFAKATANFKICIDHYLKAERKRHAAEAFTSLAGCYRETGQLEQEISTLQSAQQLYSELEDSGAEAMACLDLAKVYVRVGRREEGKRILAMAKLHAMRVEEPRTLGKLHSGFGLLYTSLGMFEDAIGDFEEALPLVRSGGRSANSIQVEASLLQNIGAAYNELGRYFDAVVYHREAAFLHGKSKNLLSECKCLCNLAFAQAQLKDYPESAKNFSNALAKAHRARSNHLQFQACEGLGAINFHMGRYGEAASYFKQALDILDEIKEETGMARERVMEKLSDAKEALQIIKAKQRQRDFSRHQQNFHEGGGGGGGGGGSVVMRTPGSSSEESDVERGSHSPRRINRRLSPEFEGVGGGGDGHSGRRKRPSLSERRGGAFLPPIDPQPQPSRKHAVPRKRNSDKNEHLPRMKESGGGASSRLSRQDSLDAEVREYISSYKDRDYHDGQSSESGSGGSVSDGEGGGGSGDQLGSSMLSRHASRRRDRRGSSGSMGSGRGRGTVSPSSALATEGCLALGQNTRELFTTQTRVVKEGRKKRTVVDIVPKTPAPLSPPPAQTPPNNSSPYQPTARTSSTQSKICVIL